MSNMTAEISITFDSEQEELARKLLVIAIDDVQTILKKNKEYGSSWKKRGGVGAFMMLARKWDRLEPQVEKHNYDVIEAMNTDTRQEGIIDDIRDLRAYLFLVQTEKKLSLLGVNTDCMVIDDPVKQPAAQKKKEFVSHGYNPELELE